MSGHMTRMSRGSSVGSSASRPSRTSRSTSIWRAGPWQLCTWTERSSLVCTRPSGRTALAVMSDCSQPSSVVGSACGAEVFVGLRVGGQAALQFAEVAAERGEQRMVDVAVAGVVAAGDRAVYVGERRHRSSLGCGSHRCRSWWVASASSSSISVIGSRVWPNSDSRSGRSVGDSLQAGNGFRDDGRVAGRRRRGRRARARAAAASARSCVEAVGVAVEPVDEQLRALPGVGREQSGEPSRDGVAPALPQLPLLAVLEVAEVGGERACTTARRGCRRSPRAAATPWRRATTDRRRRSR